MATSIDHRIETMKISIALSIIRSKPETLSIQQYIQQLRQKLDYHG